jgi:hypothetical protein
MKQVFVLLIWSGSCNSAFVPHSLRQVHNGIILSMIPSLNFYFLAVVIYSTWLVIVYKWIVKVLIAEYILRLHPCIALQCIVV